MNEVKPLVSIACITYNQESYIRKCIDGFLIQKTDFPFEIIINDDASTDNTAHILKEYVDKYPKKIIPIFQIENQYSKGINPGIEFVFPKCRGKYIALCEGDDYWTDPLKLQKQVDFLEANDDYVLCFHKIRILKNNRLIKDYLTTPNKETSTIIDIAKENYIHTPSVLFRNGLIDEFPDWYLVSPIGDHPLYILLAQFGKIKYIPEFMAVYRIHQGGVWSQRNNYDIEMRKRLILLKKNMADYFKGPERDVLIDNYSNFCLDLSEIYFKNNQKELSVKVFKDSTYFNYDTVHLRYFKYKLLIEKIKRFINYKKIKPILSKYFAALMNTKLNY